MERRRLSVHSDSSVEPMDISAKTTTSSGSTSGTNNTTNNSSFAPHSDARRVELFEERIRLHHHNLRRTTDNDNVRQDDDDINNSSFAPHSDARRVELFEERIRLQTHNLRRSTDNDNDEQDDDDEDDIDVDEDDNHRQRRSYYTHENVVRRENLRQWEAMRKKYRRPNSLNNNNITNNNNGSLECAEENGIDLRRLKTEAKTMGSTGDGKFPCPICNCVSTSQHEFTEHIRGHNGEDAQNFTCKICSKVLSSASSLDRHTLVHTGERPFNCKYCHVTFTTNGNMHRHVRTHKQRGDMPNGKAPPTSTPDTDAQYESDCGASTDSSCSLNTNNNYSHSSSIGKRKSSFDNDNDALADQKRRRKNQNNNNSSNNNNIEVADSIGRFVCPACTCVREYPSLSQLEYHMDHEHPEIMAKCRYCETVFKSHKALHGHKCSALHSQTNVTHGFKDMTFVDFSSEKFPMIARSMCEQSMRTSVSNQKFECSKCGRAFPCASSVSNHERECSLKHNQHPVILQQRQRGQSETSEEDAKRDDFFALLDLKNKSSPTESSSQSLMDTSFAYSGKSYSESVHIKQEPQVPAFHPQHRPFDPTLADIPSILYTSASGGGFMRQQLLDQSQSIPPPHSMPLTPKEASTFPEEEAQDAFTSEFRKMKLRGEFPCKLCSAVFPNLRALKGHNRVHVSSSGSGPFLCNMCPYNTNDKNALVRHMRGHNGDRPYECSLCNYAFTTKANCERHLRNRHGKMTREDVKKSIIYHPSEDSSCDDPVKKMQIYISSYDDDESLTKEMCASPVVPKEILTPTSDKSVKIQVKSMEQLIRPKMHSKAEEEIGQRHVPAAHRAVDLSMDVLDLSKKSNDKEPLPERREEPAKEYSDEEEEDEVPAPPTIPPMQRLNLDHQLLMAQHQFLAESFPNTNINSSLSQLYRNLLTFQNIHPMFMPNAFLNAAAPSSLPPLPIDVEAAQRASIPLPPPPHPMFNHGLLLNQLSQGPSQSSPPIPVTHYNQQSLQQQVHHRQKSPHRPLASPQSQELPKQYQQHPYHPEPQSYVNGHHHQQQQQQQQLHHHLPPSPQDSHNSSANSNHNNNTNNGPIKMVIKNGVLMPKQKQRRYRTERPFHCEQCSARFTLRSNMERHIKQQHPQSWSSRPRGPNNANAANGHPVMRRNSAAQLNPQVQAQPIPSNLMQNDQLAAISNQVKFAILSQQLKNRNDNKDYYDRNQNKNVNNNHIHMEPSGPFSNPQELQKYGLHMEHGDEDVEEDEEHVEDDDERDESELIIDEDSMPEDLSNKSPEPPAVPSRPMSVNIEAAKKVAETILEQAIRVAKSPVEVKPAEKMDKPDPSTSPKEAEEADLVSVSKLVDNATNAATPFGGYFRRRRRGSNKVDLSDEEGLVASESASDNNSGTEDTNPGSGKKQSAYSMAPNRVSCPYCKRMFPWTSSLRRHILTHTGQKPFKCSNCPLLFTTKSNCDRHLLRKHSDSNSAVSVYVPLEDVADSIKPSIYEPEFAENDAEHDEQRSESVTPEPIQPAAVVSSTPEPPKIPTPRPVGSSELPAINSDLPFKCHLCDASFADRIPCLEHIRLQHTTDFALLISKGAIETEASSDHQQASAEDDDAKPESRGKFPDYANRKVMCAFCMRRFWSTEDLRRHMRTHSGERPFQCNTCQRKFTLKHSMLRHQKKHAHHAASSATQNDGQSGANNSASEDMSDDDQLAPPSTSKLSKIPDLIPKELSWKLQLEHKAGAMASHFLRNNAATGNSANHLDVAGARNGAGRDESSDLIANLLGISDRMILSQVLRSSADEAAKLLGVQK